MNGCYNRHPKSGKQILNKPLCVDDFGNLVYRCLYTKKPVATDACIFIGACIPQVSGTFVCAPDAWPAFRASKACFDQWDANCNTCSNLVRHKQDKCKAGFMSGKCYQGERKFHPGDHMGMACWSART